MIVDEYGTQEWYVNGLLHRTDGPAVIYPSGRRCWVVGGKDITEEVEAWIDENNIVLPFDQESAMLFQLTWG